MIHIIGIGGDYWEYCVDNVVDFSAWLSERDLTDEEVEYLKGDGTHVLLELINEYNYREEEGHD
ncbi:TPA: hypothetical protein ACGO3A_002300 [Streptococcus suis]